VDNLLDDNADLWIDLQQAIRNGVSEASWQAGLHALTLVSISSDIATFGLPNQVQLNRIQQRYTTLIEQKSRDLLGPDLRTAFVVVTSSTPSVASVATTAAPAVIASPRPATVTADREPRLDPRMTFDTFVPGNSNRLAFAAAQTVAETPGRAYNPLMVHGNSGLGKTHLLHAIGNYIRENYPEKRVLYVSTETFLNDFIRAIQARTQMALQARYRECDVLLIDDIQFMETRGDSFHEEIFHTYNTLHGQGKQIVLTSDRAPKNLTGLQDRFRSRLLQGLITEVDQPDLETRIAILRSKAEADGVVLPTDVIEFIASRVRDNIRELEGSITMLRAHANLRQEPISLALAQKYLVHLGHEKVALKPDTILAAVAAYYGISAEDIQGPKRLRPIVHARHVAMYLMRNLLNDFSYPMIARIFDNRNHTTVISAVEKVQKQLTSNDDMLTQITALRQQLRGDSE